MPIEIQLPALSPTMSEGRITKWLKKEGDAVSPGDGIAECETDKSNLEIEATDGGTLLRIVAAAGSTVPVGAIIAWLGKPGEELPASGMPHPPNAATAVRPGLQAPPIASHPEPQISATAQIPSERDQRLRASPLARKIAELQGVGLRSISGSGPHGRIIKRDVERAMAARSNSLAIGRSAAAEGRSPPIDLPLTTMRRTIAQRLAEVKPGVPHFYLSVEVEMDQALKLREEAKACEVKFSINDVLVKAVALAVRRFPRINQMFATDRIVQLKTVDVGVAVAMEDGLITPVVKDADTKGLTAIAREVRELAERARRKALRPEEYTGGSITVSNLGMYGIDSFIAVLNPPQAAILAVGRVEPKVVVRDEAMLIRQMMSVTLSGDHRVIDGAVAAQFLQELRLLLEHPLRLLFW